MVQSADEVVLGETVVYSIGTLYDEWPDGGSQLPLPPGEGWGEGKRLI